jgi:hypothetical protein
MLGLELVLAGLLLSVGMVRETDGYAQAEGK